MQEPIIHTLKNGLKIVYVPFKGIESASVRFSTKAGSMFELSEEIGAAHLLEHLLFNGSKKYPSKNLLKDVILDVGGTYNAYTASLVATYYTKTLKTDMSTSFDFLSQMCLYPLLSEEDFVPEKSIVIQELHNKYDNVKTRFSVDAFRLMYPNQRLSYPVPGEIVDVQNLDKSIIDQFYKKYYVATNATLAVAADFDDPAVVFDLAEEYFAKMPKGPQKIKPAKVEPNFEKQYFVRQSQEVNQATFDLVYYADPAYEKDYFEISYISDILSRRLFDKIRGGLGLSYSVGCSYIRAITSGYLNISMKVDEANLKAAVDVIKEEIQKISEEAPNKVEFSRIRKSIETTLIFSHEHPADLADFHGFMNLYDVKFKSIKEIHDSYLSVKRESLPTIAKRVFSAPSKVFVLSKNLTEFDIKNLC